MVRRSHYGNCVVDGGGLFYHYEGGERLVLDDRQLKQWFICQILRSTFPDNLSSFSSTHRNSGSFSWRWRDINTDSLFTRRQRAGRQNKAGGGKVEFDQIKFYHFRPAWTVENINITGWSCDL